MFDLKTLLLTFSAMCLVFLGFTGVTWKISKEKIKGPERWFFGFLSLTAGLTLVGLRVHIPEMLSLLPGNILVFLGIYLQISGVLHFWDIKDNAIKLVPFATLLLGSIGLVVLLVFTSNVRLRLVFIRSVIFFLFGSGAVFISFHKKKTDRLQHYIFISILAGLALNYLAWMIWALGWDNRFEWFDVGNKIEALAILVQMVLLTALVGAQMHLVHNRLQHDIKIQSRIINRKNKLLKEEIEKRLAAENTIKAINTELIKTQKEIMVTLSEVVEFRSKETAYHVTRVGEYVKILCAALELPEDEVKLISEAAPMHDVGKIAVPDSILNKSGPLTTQERQIMRNHTTIGYELFHKSERPLIQRAAQIALEHHEHWDGNGYPNNKKKDDITISGRVVCACDVFDALANDRPYKESWELSRILEFFVNQKEKMFDPDVVDVLFNNLDKMLHVSEILKDA